MGSETVRAGTDVVIVGAARTPICSMGGGLAGLSAATIGAAAIREAVSRSGIESSIVQKCYVGHVLSAGEGQAPARQAATAAGLPESTVCTSVDKVCASGMKAVILAAMEIQLGLADVVVAGGMESMSGAPHLLRETRFGKRLGDCCMVDSLVADGLMDAELDCHMGMHAELCAQTYGFSRVDQDNFAYESYSRAIHARDAGVFDWEMVPRGSIAGRDVSRDEELDRTSRDSLRFQGPAFKKDPTNLGTVTAGNSSPLSDGAAALVLMSVAKAEEMGIKPLARILGYGEAETAPEKFTIAPSLSLPVALKSAGVRIEDVDLFELNEAFSVVALANTKLLGLESEKVNVFGGAVSLGHPLGCSGARIIVTLLNALLKRQSRIGAAAVCNGGGGSSALVVEVHPGRRTAEDA